MSYINYVYAKLAQLNYNIALHPDAANARLTSEIDHILLIPDTYIPAQYLKAFRELIELINASYLSAQAVGNGLTPYKLNKIQNRTAVKYIKLLLDIEDQLHKTVMEKQK